MLVALTQAWNIKEVSIQQAPSSLSKKDLMTALSRSTGEYAQKVMYQALTASCKGQVTNSSALAVSQTHLGMIRINGSSEILAEDLRAMSPGDLYYAICAIQKTKELKRCYYRLDPYDSGSREYIQIKEQELLEVEVRDIRNGKMIDKKIFFGSKLERRCGESILILEEDKDKQYIYTNGSTPDSEDLMTWLRRDVMLQQ
jgi:hypothetical protein